MYNSYNIAKHRFGLFAKAILLLIAYFYLSNHYSGYRLYLFICSALVVSAIYSIIFRAVSENGKEQEYESLLTVLLVALEILAVLFITLFLYKKYYLWYALRFAVFIWFLKEAIVQLNFAILACKKSKIVGVLFLISIALIILAAFEPLIRGYGTTMGNHFAISGLWFFAVLSITNAFYFGHWKKEKVNEAN